MTRKFFGTDGIRGRVGESPMSADFVLRLGRAAGRVLVSEGGGTVLIGKDTRTSGYMFESALEAGLSAAGVDIRLLGPMPTPGIAYLTRTFRARAGVVISASHNAFHDNGIKFFGPDGRKLSDDLEQGIEDAIGEPFSTVPSDQLGAVSRIGDAAGRYIEFCKNSVPYGMRLDGLDIVVDAANGAAYQVLPAALRELGARVTGIGIEPDGLNINRECGSTCPGALAREVVERGADLGVALDGDGDRVIMVDHRGELVDGDALLYVIARARQGEGRLQGPVVGTLMSNMGLEKAIAAMGVEFRRARVGDRHVMAMLHETGGMLGGESSGHIICLDKTTTGDGTISALQVLQAVVETGRPLAELVGEIERFPQVLVNVPVAERIDPDASESVRAAVREAETELGQEGRVLLRPSGTEPVIRVMVEGRDQARVEVLAERLAGIVEQAAEQARATAG